MKKYLVWILSLAFLYASGTGVTVYFDNTARWNAPHVYVWDSQGKAHFGSWPGKELTEKDMTSFQGRQLYKIEADDSWQIIFGNGGPGKQHPGNEQTENLPVRDGYIYTSSTTVEEMNRAEITPTGTLPIMYIVCDDNSVIDKDLADKDYRDAFYWLDARGMNGCKNIGSADEMLPLQIKARGNYTRTGFSKKPFKVKLGKKQNLLGLTPEKSKHYALLAHADDYRGFLRNFVGFNLGKRLAQLPWTPGMQPFELVINGDYRGLYFLTESVRVGDGRIDIAELDDNVGDGHLISGGYVVELDNYDTDAVIFLDDQGRRDLKITPDSPEQYSALQKKFIEEQFTVMNSLVHSHSDELWSYLDLDAAAAYYIVNEVIDHWESYHGSTYLFRDFGKDRKWTFSPLWDCGNAFQRGSNNQSYFTTGSVYGNNWINDLRKNEKFMKKVKEIWKWFWGTQTGSLESDIDAYVGSIRAAAVRDHQRWGNAPLPRSGNATPVSDNSDMDSKAASVKRYIDSKVAWLSKEWGAPDPSASVPERDSTRAADLPDYALPDESGISEVAVDGVCDGFVTYYDLFGRRIDSPRPGSVVIQHDNKKSQLVIFR